MTVLEPVIQFLVDTKKKKVTLGQVMDGADRPRKPVLRVMDRLVKEGYLKEIEDNKITPCYPEFGIPRRNPTWKILSKPVDINPRSPKRRTHRDKIWSVIRARRFFTAKELARISGCKAGTTENYIRFLKAHGYLRETGKDGHAIVYQLIKDPGPKRPILKEKIEDGLESNSQ